MSGAVCPSILHDLAVLCKDSRKNHDRTDAYYFMDSVSLALILVILDLSQTSEWNNNFPNKNNGGIFPAGITFKIFCPICGCSTNSPFFTLTVIMTDSEITWIIVSVYIFRESYK